MGGTSVNIAGECLAWHRRIAYASTWATTCCAAVGCAVPEQRHMMAMRGRSMDSSRTSIRVLPTSVDHPALITMTTISGPWAGLL